MIEKKPSKCDRCGNVEFKVLHRFAANYYPSQSFEKLSWDGNFSIPLQLVRCSKCNTVRQNPVVTADTISLLYPSETPSITSMISYERTAPKFKFSLDQIEKYCNPRGRILWDLGTRNGEFPYHSRKRGIESYGIEFNKTIVEAVNEAGIDFVYHGNVENLDQVLTPKQLEGLNIVHMNDVLEHLLEPYSFLRKLSKLQKRGDYLVLSQMDISSLGYRLLGKNWYYIHSQHIYYFENNLLMHFLDEIDYELEYSHKIAWYKSLFLLPKAISDVIIDWLLRKVLKPQAKKLWFATHRPHLYDYSFSIYKKR